MASSLPDQGMSCELGILACQLTSHLRNCSVSGCRDLHGISGLVTDEFQHCCLVAFSYFVAEKEICDIGVQLNLPLQRELKEPKKPYS